MGKNWYFKFEYRVWQSDPALSGCSLAARGFWLEMLCYMYEQDTDSVSGSYQKLARMARCDSSEVARYTTELKENGVCDVTLSHGDVTLMSRRLNKDLTVRKQNNLRKQRQRSHADVTVHSNSNSKSKSKETHTNADTREAPAFPEIADQDWGFPVQDLLNAFPDYMPDRLTPAMIGFLEAAVLPGDEAAWRATLDDYRMNFDPALNRYLPDKTANLLSVFRKHKSQLEKQRNGTSYNNGSKKRTDADVLAESADFYANYPDA